jgi:hypothetical protein
MACARDQSWCRMSTTPFALPSDRSMVPGLTIRRVAVTPTTSLMRVAMAAAIA